PALARLQQLPESLDVDRAVIIQAAPITDLRRAVDDDVGTVGGLADDGRVGDVAAVDLDAERFEEVRFAVGAGNGADGQAAAGAGLGEVAADEAGGAGNHPGGSHQWQPERAGNSPTPTYGNAAGRGLHLFSLSRRRRQGGGFVLAFATFFVRFGHRLRFLRRRLSCRRAFARGGDRSRRQAGGTPHPLL